MPRSVYPTGTAIYDPEKAWNGYTLLKTSGQWLLLADHHGAAQRVFRVTRNDGLDMYRRTMTALRAKLDGVDQAGNIVREMAQEG